jgi:hypothetical protein
MKPRFSEPMATSVFSSNGLSEYIALFLSISSWTALRSLSTTTVLFPILSENIFPYFSLHSEYLKNYQITGYGKEILKLTSDAGHWQEFDAHFPEWEW